VHPYVVESLTAEERALLERFVTDLDGPVFALTGLPEVVKGAVFARYSRSPKSLRRLLVDEFADDLAGVAAAAPAAPTTAAQADSHAGALYARIFGDYGDDSVAQLGGAHAAVEQASNLLTKQLEWGRLAAYLEQSTRYIPYDDKPGGRYRYYRDPDIMASRHAEAYERSLDGVFDTYRDLLPRVRAWAQQRFPQDPTTSDGAYRSTITAKTCDVLRGLLPAATVSNVGIFASGQSYEQLLLRLRSSELAEARDAGAALLRELRQVIPSFLTRVDRPDRGGVWTDYLADTRDGTRALAEELVGHEVPARVEEVVLTAHSDDAEVELVTGMLYPHSHLPEGQLRGLVATMSGEDRRRVVAAYVGDRTNRRHKPGRALERVWYRFDVCGDYGAFRDLQRHRMLTIEWQELSPRHGYATPPEIAEAGVEAEWHAALERQAELWSRLHEDFPRQSQYAVGFAWNLRYSLQLNARAAMQMIELRTQPQGHASYRRVCQRMHELIRDEAGHPAVASMLSFVDHSGDELGRLDAEKARAARRGTL
jgi:thymidylate synthase ThyX